MRGVKSIKEQIYYAILEDILHGEYRSRDVLNERSLVEKYKCSKAPVREALLQLCNDHVLRSIPRYGYEIIRLTSEDVRDMMTFRLLLECGQMSACYKDFTPRQLGCLAAIDEKCRQVDLEIWDHWRYNKEFHVKMISFCGNDYITDELERCMDRLERAYAQSIVDSAAPPPLSMDTKHHRLILECLERKDLGGLLQALKEDLADFGNDHYHFLAEFDRIYPV